MVEPVGPTDSRNASLSDESIEAILSKTAGQAVILSSRIIYCRHSHR